MDERTNAGTQSPARAAQSSIPCLTQSVDHDVVVVVMLVVVVVPLHRWVRLHQSASPLSLVPSLCSCQCCAHMKCHSRSSWPAGRPGWAGRARQKGSQGRRECRNEGMPIMVNCWPEIVRRIPSPSFNVEDIILFIMVKSHGQMSRLAGQSRRIQAQRKD